MTADKAAGTQYKDIHLFIYAFAGGSARLVLSRGQAHAFVIRAALLVSTGRPACPLCGRPIDAEGHMCVKTNGHKH